MHSRENSLLGRKRCNQTKGVLRLHRWFAKRTNDFAQDDNVEWSAR
jgi:hypothetical protein